MNLRRLSLFALPAALGVVIAWFWFERDANPVFPPESESASQAAPVARNSPAGEAPTLPTPPPGTLTPTEPGRMASSVAAGMPLVRTAPAAAPPIAAVPVAPVQAEPQAEERADLEGVQFMLRDFRTRLGENPVGTNAEIMKAVMGGNEARAVLGPPQGQNLNDQGELVDRWGKPYFFHQLSKNSMEIRSAGPDGRLWTSDDLIAK